METGMDERSPLRRLVGRPIARMNGIGNVIVLLDLRASDLIVSAAEARAISAAPGLRFDQLMVIHDPALPGTDGHMRIYNCDGSPSDACGNGTRCVAWWVLRGTDREATVLTAGDTRLACRRIDPMTFAVDMGVPEFHYARVPLRDENPASLDFAPLGRGFAVSTGNPHVVFFAGPETFDLDALDLARTAPPIEASPVFPERVNVSFAQVIDERTIRLRVWERGAGITLACGSGACATLVAAASTGRTGRAANVDLPGGRLAVVWGSDGHVTMTGAVELEFEGTVGAVAPTRGRPA